MSKLRLNQKAFGAIEAVFILVILVFVGFVVFNAVSGDDDSSASIDTAEALTLPSDINELLTFEEVVALTSNDQVGVVSVELEDEDGLLVYELTLTDGSKVYVDARTGNVLDEDASDGVEVDSEDEAIPAGFVAGVSLSSAIATAEAEYPDSEVEKVELEVEDGVVVWRVKFVDETKVEIDASSGAVLEVDIDNDEDEKDEDEYEDDDDDYEDDEDEYEDDEYEYENDEDEDDEDEEDEEDEDEDEDEEDEEDEDEDDEDEEDDR